MQVFELDLNRFQHLGTLRLGQLLERVVDYRVKAVDQSWDEGEYVGLEELDVLHQFEHVSAVKGDEVSVVDAGELV